MTYVSFKLNSGITDGLIEPSIYLELEITLHNISLFILLANFDLIYFLLLTYVYIHLSLSIYVFK